MCVMVHELMIKFVSFNECDATQDNWIS
jgi:hypothetical protein